MKNKWLSALELLSVFLFCSYITNYSPMSMNRMIYDSCAYNTELNQSTAPLAYVLDPIRYENCNKCRVGLGVVGGTAVSHITGNMVDLENDLRGQNRPNTHCASYKFLPPTGYSVQGKEYIKPVQHPVINTDMKHLNACQFVTYDAVPLAPELPKYTCTPK